MKQGKRFIAVGVIALMLVVTSAAAFAASDYTTPAEAIAGLTGRTTANVIAEKQEGGKSYGSMALEAGKLDDFKLEMLEIKKNRLKTKVDAGILTQDQADSMLKTLEENQALCDGTNPAKIGQGLTKAQGSGMGQRLHKGQGSGLKSGYGQACGLSGVGKMNKGMRMYE